MLRDKYLKALSQVTVEVAMFSVLLAIEDMTYYDYLERLNGGL